MDTFHNLFGKLDKNNDGFVTVEELSREMRRIGVTTADEKSQVGPIHDRDVNLDRKTTSGLSNLASVSLLCRQL